MPLIGYLLGAQFTDKIISFDHWIAFLLLGFIGGKMIKDGFAQEGCPDTEEGCPNIKQECPDIEKYEANAEKGCTNIEEVPLTFKRMLPLALATSIDALAVGVSFAFLKVDIVPAVSFIGVITLLLSMGGVKIGNVFGVRFKSKAEFAGGIILILIGLKIILEHTGILVL
jgi:putative Mn2+ efflux pump MntP